MHFCKKCVCRQEHTAVIADSIVRCKWPRFIISKNRDVNRFEVTPRSGGHGGGGGNGNVKGDFWVDNVKPCRSRSRLYITWP